MAIWLDAFLAALARLKGKKTVCRVTCGRLSLQLRLGVEALEVRLAPSAGGGFTSGGLVGQYFNNTTLSGSPSFTRTDVRVDFNWGTTLPPGGSIAAGYSALGTTNYSILWNGQVVPRYSETYTFYVAADDGARLYIRPTGTTTWTTLVDDWNNRATGTDSGAFTLTAGQSYDIELEHYQASDAGEMSLQWASPSTPREVIEPVDQQGWNILPDEFPLYTNVMWNAQAQFISGTSDALGNPTSDATILVWQGVANNQGTYQVIFNGQAQLNDAFLYASFPQSYVQNGTTFTGVYNASTNTTTATMIITDTGLENFYLNFINTRRTPTSATNTGVTNIKVMAPTTVGGSSPYSPNVYFTPSWESEASLYTVLRAYPAAGTVFNTTEVNWADRVQPTDNVQRQYGFYGGLAWEYFVQLANETGKDLWINIPENATGTSPTDTTSYVYQLAKLIANGGTDSNGVYHPGLNPNLKLYIEYTNEVWNYGFSAFGSVVALAKAAGPSSPINFDGQAFDSSGNPTNTGIFREQGERTVEISNIFRSVFGDSQMITRVRPLLEWQLGYNSPNGQVALQYIDQYYNNDDGLTHVATPHPVSYFIYGGGGSDYFNASNDSGYTTLVPNAGFETPSISGSQQAPAGAGWTFTGTAGIAANGSSLNNPTAIEGKQVAYLEGVNGTNGTISQTVTFPASQTSDVYALSFLAVERTKTGASAADTQSIDVYFDNTLIGSYTPDAYDPNNPWPEFDTATFTVPTAGSAHTIRFVGTSTSGDQTVFLDQVRVTSIDAIFNSGIPDPTYVPALQADAELAGAFGIKYVSYEGGFAVGGDDKVPLATAAYDDPRAKQALLTANTDYQQVGGALFFNGTYAMQGNNPGTLNTPLLNGVTQLDATLPAAPTLFGITGPATLPIAASVYSYNANPGTGAMSNGGWFRWDVYLPAGGQYNLSSDAGAGGTVQLLVDDVSLGSLNSANSLTAAPLNVTLTSGLHVIEVRSASGAFTLTNVFLNSGPAPTTGPALDVFNFTGNKGNEVTVNPTTAATGLSAGPISRGSGLQPDNGNPLDANSFASVSTTTVYGQNFAGAITNNQYYQFTLAPQSGVAMSLSSLLFEPEFQNAQSANGAGITYSVDGVNFTQLTATGTPGSSNPFTVNLSGAAALQGTTSTVTFRIYLWGNNTYETTALGGNGNAVIVYGSATSAAGLPAAPTNLTATAASTSQINLTWTNNAANQTGFQIDQATNSSFTTGLTTATVAANVTSYSATGLAAGTTYYFRVRATNAVGASGNSNTSSATTQSTVPAAPSNLTATAASSSQINLTWTNNASNQTGFQIDQATNSTFTTGLTTVTVAANVTSYSATGLSASTTYYFQVRATNAAGASTNSNPASATTSAAVPAAPSNLTATAASSSQINLAWTNNATNQTGFQIDQATNSTFTTGLTTVTVAANVTSYSATGLSAATTYYFRVRATNAAGASANSNTASATTAVALPAAPSNLTATAASANQINLAWTNNATNQTGFQIDQATNNTFTTGLTTVSVAANVSSYSATGLSAATTYYFRVRATNAAGASANSNTASATTSAGVPAAPSNLTAMSVSSTQINLAWTNNATNQTGFQIDQATNGSFTTGLVTVSVAANLTSYSATGLSPSTAYYFRVRATNAAGASANSNTASTTTQSTVPAAPSNLTATTASASQINLAWTNNATNQTGFQIDQATNTTFTTGLTTVSVAANVTTYSATGLAAATTYYFRVRATNAAGASANSNTASATTSATVPAAPSNLTATASSSSQINLGWTNNATNQTGFQIDQATNTTFTTGLTTISVAANVTTYNATGLSAATTYYFRVRATNAVGASANSNTASATTLVTAPAAPSNLTATAASSSQINLTWTNNATNQTGFHVDQATNSTFTQGLTTVTAAASATSYSATGLSPATTYYFRVRATNAGGDSANSNTASAVTQAAALGIFTASADIGAPGLAGSAGYNAATQTYTVQGSGSDIWNASDQFRYVDTTVTGDATIIAQVTSVTNSDPWAKSGVMFRNGTAANAAFALVAVTPGNGVVFQWRTSAGAQAQNIGGNGLTAPVWLKLARSGNAFTASYSTDGSSWTALAPAQTIAMATPTVGLAVCAHNNTLINTSTFTNVSIAAPPATPSNLTATAASPSQINLTWTNNATNQTGFQVDEATNSSFTTGLVTVSLAASATSYSATGLAAATTYYFRVRATNAAGTSANSNTASAVTQTASIGLFTGSTDIGAPGTAGSASYNAATQTYTVAGGGTDIWNASDQFHYLYTSVSGDTTLSAEVATETNSDPWAKAGVMFRDGTAANAAFAMVAVTPGNGIAFQWRTSAGAQAQNINLTTLTAPVWVELVRRGNTFTAYYSTDGVTWIMIGSPQTIAMAAATGGLAVTAHDSVLLNTSTFTNVVMTTP